jgi:predicted glycosyltransferase
VRARILIVVTHLLGVGHLTRAAALARAFAADGSRVTLASGGMPAALVDLEGIEFVQLPPIRSSGSDFKALLSADGEPVDERALTARRELAVRLVETVRPEVLITELFPFGRRVLAGEFLALLEAARAMTPRPVIASSIRDVLVPPRRPDRIAESHARLAAFYDLVLVHGDPGLVPIDASWPVDEALRPLFRYTGYVDEGAAMDASAEMRRDGIVVSGGSSSASLPLYHTALEAARHIPDRPWHLLVGHGIADSAFAELGREKPSHVRVERARRDFRAILGRAAVSVSQAGYNTVVDLLRSRTRAVLVPFEAGHETEQRLRADRLAALGFADIVPEAELAPERLSDAIRLAASRDRPIPDPPSLAGARRSVEIVKEFVGPSLANVTTFDWSPLDEAIARAGDAGVCPSFWWRDDDAVAETPALRRLLALSRTFSVPAALAVIPARTMPSLAACLIEDGNIGALVHGLSHANHAPKGEKKAEFGANRTLDAMLPEVADALAQARQKLGPVLLPVFVPPWNRIAPELVPTLPGLGFRGLSIFNDRRAGGPSGLVEINAHIDPIDWHGTRSLLEPNGLIAATAGAVSRRITGQAEPEEPIGLLTHHLVQDEPVWFFCEALLERLLRNKVRFPNIARFFSTDIGSLA